MLKLVTFFIKIKNLINSLVFVFFRISLIGISLKLLSYKLDNLKLKICKYKINLK